MSDTKQLVNTAKPIVIKQFRYNTSPKHISIYYTTFQSYHQTELEHYDKLYFEHLQILNTRISICRMRVGESKLYKPFLQTCFGRRRVHNMTITCYRQIQLL